MAIQVHNQAGETVTLADAPLASGGEANVYVVPQYPSVVVKLYHQRVLDKHAEALRQKIEVMASNARFAAFKGDDALSWPRFAVYDAQGRWCGYAMRKVGGVRMNVLAHAKAYVEHFPNLDRVQLLDYLIGLLTTVERLHAKGVLIGDYNLANFLCDPASRKVVLIDCDSWQVAAEGRLYRCNVAAPDMLAPELHGKPLDAIDRTLESELFSIAIVIFKVLMLGRHPYDVVGGAGPVENIRKGYFPYGIGGGGIPKGPWYNIWSHLSYKVKEQLIRTFKEGAQSPASRTTVREWIDLLRLYRREIGKGWHNNEIRPASPKDNKVYRGGQSLPAVGVSA